MLSSPTNCTGHFNISCYGAQLSWKPPTVHYSPLLLWFNRQTNKPSPSKTLLLPFLWVLLIKCLVDLCLPVLCLTCNGVDVVDGQTHRNIPSCQNEQFPCLYSPVWLQLTHLHRNVHKSATETRLLLIPDTQLSQLHDVHETNL